MKNYLLFILIILLVACGSAEEATNETAVSSTEPPLPAESAPDGAIPPPGYPDQAWSDIVADAAGQELNFYMWGGSDLINAWITGYVAESLKAQYDITLNMIPVTDSTEYINKVLGEKEAGQDETGTVDLVWVNGENFRTMRQGDLLYGSWSQFLPNSAYVNWDDPSVATITTLLIFVYMRVAARYRT